MILYVIAMFLVIAGFVLGVSVSQDDTEKVVLRDDQIVATVDSGYSALCKFFVIYLQLMNNLQIIS